MDEQRERIKTFLYTVVLISLVALGFSLAAFSMSLVVLVNR
jgi:hypothetical protein